MGQNNRLNVLLDLLNFDSTNNTSGVVTQYPQGNVEKISVRQYNLCVTGINTTSFNIGPNASFTVFDNSEATNLTATATFSITSSGSTYTIFQAGGTNAGFRTLRGINLGSDSALSVTINNSALVTYQVTAGTSITTSSVISGDILYVSASGPFAAGNQGSFAIVSSTTNSVSVVNPNAVAQSSVTLGASYASQFKIFSNAGVQLQDTLKIAGGFSTSTYGDYVVQGITDNTVVFNSTVPLAIESNVTPGTSGLVFYSDSPFYVFGSGNLAATLAFDGEASGCIVEPITEGFQTLNWSYLKTGTNYKLILTNNSSVNNLIGSFFLAQRV